MNISSILITIVGIIIIIALYVVSRLGQRNVPKNDDSLLPDIKDDNGDVFTSVLDDIPASDGSSPKNIQNRDKQSPQKDKNQKEPIQKETAQKHQLVLFVSANNEQGLDGNLIKKALINNGLKLGDKDIYHYIIDSTIENVSENIAQNEKHASSSLFRIANGMEPWTLKDSDLDNQRIVGLSLVMLLPSVIDNKTAIATFIEKADAIATQVNGILKNQQQEILSDEDRASILGS